MRMRIGRWLLALGVSTCVLASSLPSHAAPHTFDLAGKMPNRLSIMFSVSWFGLGKSDPQGAGPDPSYGNWHFDAPACGLTNDPATCADFPGAGKQRSIASKRRPMTGIYSSSGRDAESKRKVDLVLSTIRRPCDDGARLDAFAVQLDSIKFTSAHPANKQSGTWDIAYRALLAFYERADAAGLTGAVAAANDSTVYWHFGDTFGLTTQAQRIAALTDDIVETVAIADAHPSATRIGGKLLLVFYTDAALISDAEWKTLLDDARTKSGKDFYTLDTELHASFFNAFDALAPWMNLGHWSAATGATVHDRAVAWQEAELGPLLAALPSYPGRVVFGSVTPGFDDYTMDWGACSAREIPRDPQLMAGQMEVNGKHGLKGLVAETWDDWTEGHELEPDVVEGTTKLVQLRRLIGTMFGDPVDPAGDARLDARWKAFGQARSCCYLDGSCGDAGAPPVDLGCADAGVDGGGDAMSSDTMGHDGGDGSTKDVGTGSDGATGTDAGGDATSPPGGQSGGCSCTTLPSSRAKARRASTDAFSGAARAAPPFFGLAALALLRRRRRPR